MFGWSAVQLSCSRNVVHAWKQSVRSNWSNAKIRRPNLHLIFQNTTEPISTKIDSYRAPRSAFHLGVQDPSVAYRVASCIAIFKVSEGTWLNLYLRDRFIHLRLRLTYASWSQTFVNGSCLLSIYLLLFVCICRRWLGVWTGHKWQNWGCDEAGATE